MGAWGTGLYSDDLAGDIRRDFRDLIGEGFSPAAAVDRLTSEYADSLTDPDDGPVFWLALADTGWRLGRLDDRVRVEALRAIDEGRDLRKWTAPRDRRRREGVLEKLRSQLLSPPPAPKYVPRPVKAASDWKVGEVIAFRLLSGRWVPLRVIGHHTDKGGRSAVCELLEWTGASAPSSADVAGVPVRRATGPAGVSQFLFQEPRRIADRVRVARTGIMSKPSQAPGGFTAFVWPYVDRLMHDVFALE